MCKYDKTYKCALEPSDSKACKEHRQECCPIYERYIDALIEGMMIRREICEDE